MQAPQAPSQHRRQLPARGPPVAPTGMPVRDPQQQGFVQPSYKQSLPAQHAPARDYRQTATYRSYASSQSSGSSQDTYGQRYAHAYGHAYAHGPGAQGLRESTRVNIKGSAPPSSMSPRQISATLDWQVEGDNEWMSPKEPDLVTPKEQYSAQVDVRDHVDSQFENLLVGCLIVLNTSGHANCRTLCKCPRPSAKSFTPSRTTSRRASSIHQ